MEKALFETAERLGFADPRPSFERLEEVPFTPERKTMTVLCRSRNGRREFFTKGAPEIVLDRCASIRIGDRPSNPMTEAMKRVVSERVADLSGREAKRVIALARGPDPGALEFAGVVAFLDPPRPDVADSIRTLKQSKVNVSMITGDSKETAAGICAMIGLGGSGILISGAEMDKMSDRDLSRAAENCFCYYRTSPKHKVRIVKALQGNGHVVAMTGDGVNDGVAIRKSDVGVSMGITGTDVCKEAADVILLDDDFTTILHAIEEGKCIFYNIQNFVRFQLSTSIAALLLISISTLLDIPNPLNPMQILWINVIMDGPPAQSLGLEPVDPDVLKRPPRKKSAQILTRDLLVNVLISAAIILGGTLFVFSAMMEDGKMTPRDTTMTFTCFVFFDMFNALTSRSQERLIGWEIGLGGNVYFVVAVTLSILCQLAVIYLGPLQYVFQTEALTAADLAFLAALASSVFIAGEAKKILVRVYRRRKRPRKAAKFDHVV